MTKLKRIYREMEDFEKYIIWGCATFGFYMLTLIICNTP